MINYVRELKLPILIKVKKGSVYYFCFEFQTDVCHRFSLLFIVFLHSVRKFERKVSRKAIWVFEAKLHVTLTYTPLAIHVDTFSYVLVKEKQNPLSIILIFPPDNLPLSIFQLTEKKVIKNKKLNSVNACYKKVLKCYKKTKIITINKKVSE